ncbi:MAG TPA: hypothetical protein VFB34_11260, partial [Chloroflexota bacterium]|nr:hypothetical protein [Chloroflexota bacterium]
MKYLVLLPVVVMVAISGCGSSSSTSTPPSKHHSTSHSGAKQSSGSHQAAATTGGSSSSAWCGDINGAKLDLQNLKRLGSQPSPSTLISDLKKLDSKIAAATPTAPARLSAGFHGVKKADEALQTGIQQLQASGASSALYVQPVKAGVAGIATAFQVLVSLS